MGLGRRACASTRVPGPLGRLDGSAGLARARYAEVCTSGPWEGEPTTVCGNGRVAGSARTGGPAGRKGIPDARSHPCAVCWATPWRWAICVVLRPSSWYSRRSSAPLGARLRRPGARRAMPALPSHHRAVVALPVARRELDDGQTLVVVATPQLGVGR